MPLLAQISAIVIFSKGISCTSSLRELASTRFVTFEFAIFIFKILTRGWFVQDRLRKKNRAVLSMCLKNFFFPFGASGCLPLLPFLFDTMTQSLHSLMEFEAAHSGEFPDVAEHLVLTLTQ